MTNINRKKEEVISWLIYILYKKMYGVKDEPFESIGLVISESSSEWNKLSSNLSQNLSQPYSHPYECLHALSIREKDDRWNKLATDFKNSSVREGASNQRD